MNNESQEEVLAFLGDPETHGDQKVHRIDTHAAAVFLAGDRALKIKRAVRFPFLDYSTLGKRKQACEAELAVNAPYAPEIYRGVKAITREADGRLAIAGAGSAVEWAVEMRRFDEQRTLDHLAGEIDDALAEALGRAVAAAHAKAPAVEAKAWIDAVGSYIDEHTEAFGAHTDIFPAAEIDVLARVSRTAYDHIVPLLTERGRRGLIRRIHGDLHLGNIVLIDGRPVLFDAIEFSDIIASGDVLYDLAFLLMDLLERGLDAAANIVFNRYLAETRRADNLDALAALPFFLSMRAAIRAKVTAARMELALPAERPPIARAARGYLPWPSRRSRRRRRNSSPSAAFPAPARLCSRGQSRRGSSRCRARSLCARDIERKALFGIAETEKLPADAYEQEVTARVYATLTEKARRILAAGHSAIVDAVFADPRERAGLEAMAKSANIPLRGLFLTADLDTRIARVGSRARDASDADASVAQAQERYDLGPLEWTAVDASGTPAATLARARAALPQLD